MKINLAKTRCKIAILSKLPTVKWTVIFVDNFFNRTQEYLKKIPVHQNLDATNRKGRRKRAVTQTKTEHHLQSNS